MIKSREFSRTVAALLFSGLASVSAGHAASIGLSTNAYPDLTLDLGTLTYTFTKICQNSTGSSIGTCTGPRTIDRWDLSYGRLTLTSTTLAVVPDNSSLPFQVTGDNYNLTVVFGFNSTGTALSGILASDPYSGDALYTTSLNATGTTTNPSFQSGTLVTGTPTDATAYGYAYPFGYSGFNGAGTFEFVFNNVGGDFAAFGSVGKIVATMTTLTSAVGNWDSLGIDFWKTGHSATGVAADTVVPVPAAVWLLGSGLMSLFGVRLTRKHREV
jgi:hypothetical protein